MGDLFRPGENNLLEEKSPPSTAQLAEYALDLLGSHKSELMVAGAILAIGGLAGGAQLLRRGAGSAVGEGEANGVKALKTLPKVEIGGTDNWSRAVSARNGFGDEAIAPEMTTIRYGNTHFVELGLRGLLKK